MPGLCCWKCDIKGLNRITQFETSFNMDESEEKIIRITGCQDVSPSVLKL